MDTATLPSQATLDSRVISPLFVLWDSAYCHPSRKPSLALNTLGVVPSYALPQPLLSYHRPQATPCIRQSPGPGASPPRPVTVPAALSRQAQPWSESRLQLKARLRIPETGRERLDELEMPKSSLGMTADTFDEWLRADFSFILTSEADGAAAKSWSFRANPVCTFILSLSLFPVYNGDSLPLRASSPVKWMRQ